MGPKTSEKSKSRVGEEERGGAAAAAAVEEEEEEGMVRLARLRVRRE